MFQAWFYYVLPLAVAALFVVIGALIFRSFKQGGISASGKKIGSGGGVVGIAVVIVGAAFGLVFVLTTPSPRQRQKLFDCAYRTPAENIERFIILPASSTEYKPLTRTRVVIDDSVAIRRIAGALRTARETWPNHPQTRWTARVQMVTDGGTCYFRVTATEPADPNGTLVSLGSATGNGWNLGDVSAEGLDAAIEEAVKAAMSRPPANTAQPMPAGD